MIRTIVHVWNSLTASRDWTAFRVRDHKGLTGYARMRRWTGAGFEYRDCTEEEARDASWHWAIR